tara:strand:- start:56 stop:463 length:408 start_codon:yes stop_codon:yes gene_type:complete
MTTKKTYSTQNPNPIDVRIGRRLRRIRKIKRITQKELGAAVGTSFQQIQKYERAANRISTSKLVEIATFLGVTIHYFTGPIGRKNEQHQFDISDDEAMLLYCFEAIKNELMKDSFLKLARAVAENPLPEVSTEKL